MQTRYSIFLYHSYHVFQFICVFYVYHHRGMYNCQGTVDRISNVRRHFSALYAQRQIISSYTPSTRDWREVYRGFASRIPVRVLALYARAQSTVASALASLL